MINRVVVLSVLLWAASGLCIPPVSGPSASAQTANAQTWALPHGTAVRDAGPRSYQFTVVYNTANRTGEVIRRQRITGEYTRGLANGEVAWKNVAEADADGATGPFGTEQRRDFMEGFRYRNDVAATMAPDFFKTFPPSAVLERNLVWDTGMFETFGQNHFDELKLNEPLHAGAGQNVQMPDVGTFHNRDIVLEWVGRSIRNGQDCAVIEYRAFFNPLQLASGGMTLQGRSDYWGEIWVSLGTKQIEYATIYEEVSGEMKLPGQDTPQLLSVFRIGSLEPLNTQPNGKN